LIYEAAGHDVETVLVDGQVVMRDRKVTTVDIDQVLALA
jgi:cytosine/adenosine deaminase-related metal-dependent hydrolase